MGVCASQEDGAAVWDDEMEKAMEGAPILSAGFLQLIVEY